MELLVADVKLSSAKDAKLSFVEMDSYVLTLFRERLEDASKTVVAKVDQLREAILDPTLKDEILSEIADAHERYSSLMTAYIAARNSFRDSN